MFNKTNENVKVLAIWSNCNGWTSTSRRARCYKRARIRIEVTSIFCFKICSQFNKKSFHQLFQSGQIRTIIKAKGLAHPNVTGKTFAVFRVDTSHHLVSFVSMIDPSPDWFLGVSGLELCLENCTWAENRILDLFPWDAGTDSGPTYTVRQLFNYGLT